MNRKLKRRNRIALNRANRIEVTMHTTRGGTFATSAWRGSKYRSASIFEWFLNNENLPVLLGRGFDVTVVDTIDFGRMKIIVRKDVLFGLLPYIYRAGFWLKYKIMGYKAHFMLWLQSHGWSYTVEGSYYNWIDVGKRPPKDSKKLAKDILKMWKER